MNDVMKTNAEFDFMVQELGGFDRKDVFDEGNINFIRRVFPPSICYFLEKYGVGSAIDGLFNTCISYDFRSIIALVFKGDKEFSHTDCNAVSYTAFGVLSLWSTKYGLVDIDLPRGMVFCQALAPTIFKDGVGSSPKYAPNDNHMTPSVIPFSKDGVDYFDYIGEPMYDRCQEKYGKLEYGECYGFFPALALAGELSKFQCVENIKRVKAIEHFAILAQIGDFHLTKIGPDGFERVRLVG